MKILGDIGNTETKVCLVSSNNRIIKKISFLTKNVNQSKLNKLFNNLKIDYRKINKIVFCSVVPKSFNLIKSLLSKKTEVKCYEVKNLNLKSLIKINVNYNQVGSDRITNAISLMDNKKNFIILDFGTATTFDVLIKDTYAGGIIAPGVKLSLSTLHDKATLIPKINLKKITKVIGKDTISAVRAGFFWGYSGLIDNIINLIKKETRKSFKVIITGGLSDLFKNSINTKVSNNKNNFIILDFGTATTFDVLIKNTYYGGIIAPGVRLSLNTLSDKATLIPKIDLKKINKVIGKNTISAVRSGFFWGYAGLIDNIINLIKKETRESFKVIITGGFSNLFKNSIKTKASQNQDITIKGLIKISKLIK